MISVNVTKDYIIWRRIRKMTICLLIVSILCLLFVLSYYITSNSTSTICDPNKLLNDFVFELNNKDSEDLIKMTNIQNEQKISKYSNLDSLNEDMNNLDYKNIQSSGNSIVVQTSDYVIYNSTFKITETDSDTYSKTVPIMFVKEDNKWYIDCKSLENMFS